MKTNKIFLILFFTLILLLILNLDLYAANAGITLEPETVEVGKPVKITVSGSGVQWNLKLKVDGEVLQKSSELENYESNKNISFSVSYTPTTAGTKNVTLEGSVTEFSDGSTVRSFSPKTITVKAEEPKEDDKNQNQNNDGSGNQNSSSASNNAYLSTLGVTPKEYDFSGFKKTTMNYSVTIPYEVDSLKVLYKTDDSNAKVKVTGNSGFEVGSNNKITIVVTAQDGKTTQTYTIKVTKLAQKEDTPTTPEQPKEKSTNAYLSTLGVTPKEYDFSGFKKTTMNYSVTIPYEVDSLKVLYKTADSGATVKVTGNSGFEVGSNNKITINVTAEDGKSTKTYTIKVTKLVEEEEKPGNVIEEEKEGLFLTSLSIEGVDISPEFFKDTYAYTATLDETDITQVEVEAKANKENASIEISGNTNLVVGENTINIVVKQEDSMTQTVYQITLTKKAAVVTTTDSEDINFMSSLIDNIKNYIIIAVIVIVIIIAAIIILIVLLRKENKRLKNEETEEEYNVYENDEKEFEDNEDQEVIKEKKIEEVTDETETKNERRTRRREKGKHSK